MKIVFIKGLLLICILGLAFMFFLIWIRYPDNHGAGPFSFRIFFLVVLLLSIIVFGVWKSTLTIVTICCVVIGLLLTWFVDWRNIMVDYDIWIERGMPAWGQVVEPNANDGNPNG